MPPAHLSGIPHDWPGSLLRKRLLKAQFGAVLSGDKPTCFPSLARCCTLHADKGHLSSAGCRGSMVIAHAPQNISTCGEEPTAPAGYLNLPGTPTAAARASLTQQGTGVRAPRSACCRTRAESCRRGFQVNARGCAQSLYSLPSPSPYWHSCSRQCNWGWGGQGGIPQRRQTVCFPLPAAFPVAANVCFRVGGGLSTRVCVMC